ncbi:hypothetical protein, partial [Pseudaminobacter soli (ex Li et al. 2025)]|uniref:hypothetical protein n=1 Tax=Pseudaminobacter soli (ex Li et al. 2025) TaxID=1295366 RepID=UPI001AECFBFD
PWLTKSSEPRERPRMAPGARVKAGRDIVSDDVCSLKTEDRRKRNVGGRDLLDPERNASFAVMGQSETLADTFREKVTRF